MCLLDVKLIVKENQQFFIFFTKFLGKYVNQQHFSKHYMTFMQ